MKKNHNHRKKYALKFSFYQRNLCGFLQANKNHKQLLLQTIEKLKISIYLIFFTIQSLTSFGKAKKKTSKKIKKF